MGRMNKVVVLMAVLILLVTDSIWAYEKKIHLLINENAVLESSQLNAMLVKQLGISEGVREKIRKGSRNQRIQEWIKYGGKAEDDGYYNSWAAWDTRAFNHFHDPLRSWDIAGLGSSIHRRIYFNRYHRYPASLVLWALDPGRQAFSILPEKNFQLDWSWSKAREAYYRYLTGNDAEGNNVAENERERDAFWADCLRAVGQAMHLLADTSVPLHTRDDSHWPWESHFENYTKKNSESLDFLPDQPNDLPSLELLSDPQADQVYTHIPPISALFDSNRYDGSSIPGPGSAIGLSEYSNANFVTEDTIWTYPHPSIADTNFNEPDLYARIRQIKAEDGETDSRIYFSKHSGEPIENFVAANYWYYQLYLFSKPEIKYGLLLDETCYAEYAAKLIPRAVGYTGTLLDYFFRGTMEITDFDIGFDLVPGHYQDTVGFNKISLTAKNTSPETEQMDEGTIHLVVKYKVDENDRYQHTPPDPSMEYQYITKQLEGENGELLYAIPQDDSVQLEFDLSENPIPLNATEIYFYLVYRGTLGLENDGIGVGYAPYNVPRIIELGLSDKGVYALTDQDPTDIDPITEGFDAVTLSAKNIEPSNRDMTGGTVRLVVKYLASLASQFQNRPPFSGGSFNYIVLKQPDVITIPRASSPESILEFDLSDVQIPLWATDVYLYLVYKGRIGILEEDIAMGFKDISEPTPISFYNNMDKICIQGDMLDAGSLEAIQATMDAGMADEWDIYSHDVENIYVKFSPWDDWQYLDPAFTNYTYKIPYQEAGEYLTLFILTDYQFSVNHSYGDVMVNNPTSDRFDHYYNFIGDIYRGPAVSNQIEVEAYANPPDATEPPYLHFRYLRHLSEFVQFRDIGNTFYVFGNENWYVPEGSPDNANCSYD